MSISLLGVEGVPSEREPLACACGRTVGPARWFCADGGRLGGAFVAGEAEA